MHLLIDVRTSCLSDLPNLYYAEIWADTWLSYNKNDRITFLAFEGDPIGEYECIFLSRKWTPFQKKLASHKYWPDRIISFSKLPPIDRWISSILHINELTSVLYPQAQQWFFTQHVAELGYKKNLKHSKHIIIPHKALSETLSELYGINDTKISVIPYLSSYDKDFYKNQTILPHGISGEYFITEWTPWDEWNPIGLLKAFREYISKVDNPKQLIILWDVWDNLGFLSSMIRSLWLMEKVKILWMLLQKERSLLYAHAQWWIYIWYYYSRWSSVELANSYNLPLFLSDIPWLSGYIGNNIHPNHVDALPEILRNSSGNHILNSMSDNESMIRAYARIISD